MPASEARLLVYSPLKEHTPVEGWDKSSVEYVNKNRSKLLRYIAQYANRAYKGMVNRMDVDDIYSELLLYMYKYADYTVFRGSHSMSLEQYVRYSARICVKRFVSENYGKDISTTGEFVRNSEGDEMSIFDTIESVEHTDEFDEVITSLQGACEVIRSKRYVNGIDILQMWYIRLLTIKLDIPDEFESILKIVAETDRALLRDTYDKLKDEEYVELHSAIALEGIEESIEIISKHIHGVKGINEAVRKIVETKKSHAD